MGSARRSGDEVKLLEDALDAQFPKIKIGLGGGLRGETRWWPSATTRLSGNLDLEAEMERYRRWQAT
jgi:hypothetical protein